MEDRGRLWLFTNSYKKTDKHPAFTGNGEVSIDVLKELVNEAKANPPEDGILKLDVAAWEKEAQQSKKPYLFVTFTLKDPKYASKDESKQPAGTSETASAGAAVEEDVPW